jgi:hypothetical protein
MTSMARQIGARMRRRRVVSFMMSEMVGVL